jgi:hypothetical protein
MPLSQLVNVVQTLLDQRGEKSNNTIFRIDIYDDKTPFKISVPENESYGVICPALVG